MIKDAPLVDQYMYDNTFSERFSDGIGLIYFVFTVIFVTQYFFRKLFGLLILKAVKSLCSVACACCLQSERQKEKE